ncbi:MULTISPECIES: aspartate/glutamate racemase family protein [Aquimarina]|uniref:aspartate/glutamate racemase family protein n=1 Tax=Aquimarina TaxID=290174 RepID=UPI00040AE586|nr:MULTISPECIES: amino acid racemase [Aquimarina]AXT56540.1 aspartate/glutamate racemase family protein [Aquimarina sp. AD1]RKN21938.1 aspartate/glutamate racemase family protein [Aquimarina sp. AD1]
MSHKKLGIISGMGTKAGLLFINKLTQNIQALKDQDFPEFIVHNNSQVPDRTLAIVYGQESPNNQLLRSLDIMRKCNVDYIVSTCITSYFFLNQLENELRQNILNPIDLVADTIMNDYIGVQRVGLLATTGTIKSRLFHNRFENLPFELITLDDIDQEEKFMKSVYMQGGLKSAQISQEAYALFQEAVNRLKHKNIDLIIGGCTEVQIGYSKTEETIPYLDAVDVLVDTVINKLNLKSRVLRKKMVYHG